MLDAIRSQRSLLRSRGLYLGLLPVLCFVLALRAFEQSGESSRLRDPPDAPASPVIGWLAQHESERGPRVHARLMRLHARAERQAFESRALARRLDLGPGEPWRLVLRLSSGGPTGGQRAHLHIGALALEDEAGVALRTIRALEPAPRGGVADPLAALLAPPAGVRGGEEVGLVLWGRSPGAGARLRGLLLAEHEGDAGRAIELALEQRTFDPGAAEEALASTVELERGAGAGTEETREHEARRRR